MTLSISPIAINNSGGGNETVAAGATTVIANTSTIDGSAAVALGFYARCTFNASATAGARVHVYGIPADVPANWAGAVAAGAITQSVDIPLVTGVDRAVSFSVLPGHKYYKAVVENLDPAQSITAVYVFAEPQVLS